MKIALITGGSRGIGKSAAIHAARKGHGVVITYHSAKDEAEKTVKEIESHGGKATALQLDVTKIASFGDFAGALAQTLGQKFGVDKFDYLVNNAGIAGYVAITDVKEDQFDGLYNAHVKGPFFLTQKLLPLMNNGGSIINISSGLTRMSSPGSAPYAMMKGALEVFTRYLAKELGARQITANTVAPGAVKTDFGGGHTRNSPELQKMISSVTALGRVAEAEDIGPVIASLMSDDNHWVTGQRIEASGGMVV